MHLWGRRRTAVAGLFAVVAAALGIGLTSLASAGATPAPTVGGDWTITFRPVGDSCGSQPDPASLTIARGTRVTLVNETGVTAVADIGAKKPPTIAAGADYQFTPGTGEHPIRMVPQCPVLGEVDYATVYVEKSPASVGPGPDWSDAPALGTPPAGSPPPTLATPVADQGARGGSDMTAVESLPSSTSPGPIHGSPPVLGGGPGSSDIGARLPIGDSSDTRGVNLLGVVALICILGVGVGIIRVIRAQRASSAQQRVT